MILRLQRHLALIFVIVLNVIHAKSDSTFESDCSVSFENIKFDLKSLGVRVVNQTRETPPSTTVDMLRISLCADLEPQNDLSEEDQVRFDLIPQSTLGSRVPHALL